MGVAETTVSSMRKAGTEPRVTQAIKLARGLETFLEELMMDIACGLK